MLVSLMKSLSFGKRVPPWRKIILLFGNSNRAAMTMATRNGAMLKALPSHKCGPGWIRLGAVCGLSLCPSTKTNISKFQLVRDTGPAWNKKLRLICFLSKYCNLAKECWYVYSKFTLNGFVLRRCRLLTFQLFARVLNHIFLRLNKNFAPVRNSLLLFKLILTFYRL